MLLAAALAILVAWGAISAPGPASSLRVEVTAVIGLLAPLSGPAGARPARARPARRRWSAAAVASAALACSPSRGSMGRVASACAMLMAILVLTPRRCGSPRALVARHDRRCRQRPELAGRSIAGARRARHLPFWLGPIGASLTARIRHHRIVVALSRSRIWRSPRQRPLHNPWLYEHSNLAVLAVSFPELGTLAGFYAAARGAAIVALASGDRASNFRHPARSIPSSADDQEKTSPRPAACGCWPLARRCRGRHGPGCNGGRDARSPWADYLRGQSAGRLELARWHHGAGAAAFTKVRELQRERRASSRARSTTS